MSDMEDLHNLQRKPDQHVSVTSMFATVIFDPMETSNPPVMDLMLDVEHIELKQRWRTGVRLSKNQIGELTELLVHTCRAHKIPVDLDDE